MSDKAMKLIDEIEQIAEEKSKLFNDAMDRVDTLTARVAELEEERGRIIQHNQAQELWLSDDRDRYLKALEYMADETNWINEDGSGFVAMKRKGGGGQVGIMLISNTLYPWVFATEAIGRD